MAHKKRFRKSDALLENLESRVLMSGSGLAAVYYANADFTGASATQTDSTVDFNWAGASPAPGIGATHFSTRWTGLVTAASGGAYTFSVQATDGVRLWINNQILINDWNTHTTPVTDTANFTLVSNQPATIRLEYFDGSSAASVHLSWSSASVPQEIIPAANLAPTSDALLGEIDNALGFARQQLNTTLTAMNGNTAAFPFYTNPNGTWATSNVGNWTAGFFSSEMWQMFSRTNDPTWEQKATTWTLPLGPDKSYTDDLTFRIFNSYFPLYENTGNPAYKQVILDAIASKVSTWNPTVGSFSSVGVASHSGNPNANFGVLMDHMMDFSMVMWGAKQTGNQTWYNEALATARTVAKNFFRANGSVYQWGYFDKSTGQFISGENYQGYSDSSAWARAQAWAIYAFSVFYRETGQADMLADAERVANYFIANLPADQVPYWDFNSPDIPNTFRDTSAAAIAASGLLQLGNIDPDSASGTYYNEGRSILSSLLSPTYLAEGTSSQGLLQHGAWFVPAPINNGDASLIWGDYYVVEAMNEYLAMPGALPGTLSKPLVSTPTVTVSGKSTANAGGSYTLTLGPVNDKNGTPSKYLVHWGDGTTSTYTTLGSFTHTFAKAGAESITVDVTDATGTYSSAGALNITVDSAPKIALGGATAVAAKTVYSLTLGTVTDPGYTVSQYTVHWGDGTSSTYTAGGVVTHTYAAARSATITVDLKDQTGTFTSAGTKALTVTNANIFTTSADIGAPTVKGSTSFSLGTYTVAGAGANIGGTSDQFRYYYKSQTGNFTAIARIATLQNIGAASKAGIMIRNGTAANAAMADIFLTPTGTLAFQTRTKAAATATQTAITGKKVPLWVKLVRSSSVFTAFYSSDGKTWTQLGKAVTVAMSSTVTTGLAVSSLNTAKTCTATFSNVSVG